MLTLSLQADNIILNTPLKGFEEYIIILNLWCVARLVQFVQFKKREKHAWRTVTFSKVAGWEILQLLSQGLKRTAAFPKKCSELFLKTHRRKPAMESFRAKFPACNFLKKNSITRILSLLSRNLSEQLLSRTFVNGWISFS